VQRCAGLGWAKDAHRVCVLGGDGNSLLQRSFVHDERDLNGMCELLVGLGVKRLAIERPHGIVVERLLEAGLIVLPIHPNQLKAARPRFRAAGGKSDSFDAFCLAELARTDHRRFRVLAPDSDETKALRALTRAREALVKTKVSLTNRLQAELDAFFWPGATAIFCRLDSPIAPAFLERYPSPTDAKASGEKRLAGFLAHHGYCGGKSPAELLAKLRSAPRGRAREEEEAARRAAVLSLLAVLRPVVEQIGYRVYLRS
jgi:transposase